jgi:hypothetical protein
MKKKFETIIGSMLADFNNQYEMPVIPGTFDLSDGANWKYHQAWQLSVAFLIVLSGSKHPDYRRAKSFLEAMNKNSKWYALTKFYLEGISLIIEEINNVTANDTQFARDLSEVAEWISDEKNRQDNLEIFRKVQRVFFPESRYILRDKETAVQELRRKRKVFISELNAHPIRLPHQEILFTANVLLTIPPASQNIAELTISDSLKNELNEIVQEPQLYWYDHPVQIGVVPEQNEILYGLRALDNAIAFEKERNHIPAEGRLTCLLSVSVTHEGLHRIASQYLKEELQKLEGLNNLTVYIFTETDCEELRRILFQVVAHQHRKGKRETEWLQILGVDGEYGRHYNFLKAIAAFWHVLVDPRIRATFKFDLDQVFPQAELVKETGKSAFEHFQTPLWGAKGVDSWGQQVELGMIAGALVNQSEIGKSLFTADIKFPEHFPRPDEYIFFSSLPQALSTEAEMMTRYNSRQLDGKSTCLQRIHVTGGTNGILIDALRRFQPFTPSFIGRAEDQAYILPNLLNEKVNLGYVHKDGLIMRHDKETFAREAIKSAQVGKLVGDYVRILYFSEYAGVIDDGLSNIKEKIDPFTGCFVSRIPVTVVYLRLALKAISLFAEEKKEPGLALLKIGRQRIQTALRFTRDDPSKLHQKYKKEKEDWSIYYDVISIIEKALQRHEPFAVDLKEEIREFITERSISSNI